MSWASRKRLRSLVRSTLWVVPAISTLAAFLSVPLLRVIDRSLGFHFFRYTPDGARALAAIVAAAMLSFVVLFFSVLLLTVQIASSTLSGDADWSARCFDSGRDSRFIDSSSRRTNRVAIWMRIHRGEL